MVSINKYKVVAFDIDGTLYPNGAMYRATFGLVVRNLRLFRAYGRARRQVRREYPLTDLRQRTTELTAQFARWDIDETDRRIRRIVYEQWEQSLQSVRLFPGAKDLLLWLRQRGVLTVAMSDFPVTTKLKSFDLEDCWDLAFSSEEVGYLKPRPEPFLHILEKVQHPAAEVLYVGNSYHYDILGASAVGMATAHITRGCRGSSAADFRFSRYDQLQAWLESRTPE